MDKEKIKEILKPNLKKVVVFLIISMFLSYLFYTNIPTMDGGSKQSINDPIELILACFCLFFGAVSTLGLILLFVIYCISCLIIYAYDKHRMLK